MNVALAMPRAQRRATIMRARRCLSVSVGTTALSAAILVSLTMGAGVPAGMANVGVFAALWLAQFIVLDRVIFRDRAGRQPPSRAAAGIDTEWEIS